jgi:hypothetical protein
VTPLSFDPLASGPLLAGAVLATVASLWLLLPNGRDNASTRWLGTLLGLAALAAFIATGRRLGGLGGALKTRGAGAVRKTSRRAGGA